LGGVMKKLYFLLITMLMCFLPLSACNNVDTDTEGALAAPENLRIEIDYVVVRTDYYVCWDDVKGADYYFITVADVKDYLTYDTRYYFDSATAGEVYTVSVWAVSLDGDDYTESAPASAELTCYAVKEGYSYTLSSDKKGYVLKHGSAQFSAISQLANAYACIETELIFPDYYRGMRIVEVADSDKELFFVGLDLVGAYFEYIRLPAYLERLNASFGNSTLLMHVTLPETLTEIGESAFARCINLLNVNVPSGVKSIGNNAFGSCRQLTKIILPEGLEKVGINAFRGCAALTSAIFKNTEGWTCVNSSASAGVSISVEELSSPHTAASYLTDTYVRYTWECGLT